MVVNTAFYHVQPQIFIIYWIQPQIFIIYWMQLSGIRVSILGQFIGYFSNLRYLHLYCICIQIEVPFVYFIWAHSSEIKNEYSVKAT